ncbi:thiamine pyrophosphate-dependent enzyme [Kribbella sp. NPDC056861]|uniref:thiamine pyrophosphate-dependent enzyme n=1 Tax=Kribbella sp. NPDC056861 TaxID=3154857 RepID=UPI0034342A04
MSTVAELLVESLAEHGVTSVWGVVGDALNPVTDAIRREDRVEWIGVRHEEAGAFAAGGQASLTGRLGVCMGTVGPGAIHLLNGLYDAAKSRVPVLAICGQVPREEIGSNFFQEVNNDVLFADVAVFSATVSTAEQAPALIEQAVNAALAERGVAVLSIPGDVGGLEVPKDTPVPQFHEPASQTVPEVAELQKVAAVLNAAERVTLLVGAGARDALAEVQQLASTLAAPAVLTLKAKEGFEENLPQEVGQSGLLGNHATKVAFDGCDVLFLVGTDFPYREFLPAGKTVVQLDLRGGHIGRRVQVDHGLVGHAQPTLAQLLPLLEQKSDTGHLDKALHSYAAWRERQVQFTDPAFDRKPKGLLRRKVDNPEARIRPELLAAMIDRHADDDAVFTSDTGMSTVWLARFVRMRGDRRLIGSYNLGSMANAMPQALGLSAVDRDRQVIAFCGDGGLSMLLGDLITAVAYELPVKLVVFNNGRLGMVKLEMEQVGLPEYGTKLANPDFSEVAKAIGLTGFRVERPGEVEGAVEAALRTPGPVLIDVVTNADEIALPPSPTLQQGWGFAIAKSKEFVESHE